MLKVLKYDWRNGWNAVKFTLVAAVVLSILLGLSFGRIGGVIVATEEQFGIGGESTLDTITMVLSVVWFAVMMALLILTVDAICRNLSGRMFGSEGYLTHTLPVKTWELLVGKVLGTWLFGVFMLVAAIALGMLVMLATAAGTGAIGDLLKELVAMLPKMGAYHFRQLATGFGYLALGILDFLAWSLVVVIQYQFICIAARQFGKHYVAGGIIVFIVLVVLENKLNAAISLGFVVSLATTAACFFGSQWLLKHRLSL